jgi:hypothetical protein
MKPRKEKQDDPKQSKRFIDAAKQVEADETKEGADNAFKKAVTARSSRPIQKR